MACECARWEARPFIRSLKAFVRRGTRIITLSVTPLGQPTPDRKPGGCGWLCGPPGIFNRGFEGRVRELKSLEG